jgi:hypothetical protein
MRLPVHLMNTEPRAYKHINKFNDMSYEKINSTYEHIMFVSWGLPVFTAMRIWIVAFCANIPLIATFHTKLQALICPEDGGGEASNHVRYYTVP